jgi:hypothetical protein
MCYEQFRKMKAGITLKQVWSDDDLVELEVASSDGTSMFCTKVYVGCRNLEQLTSDLEVFRNHLHGGLYNISFGQFGPEYASGAFEARLHFYKPGRLAVSVRAESGWHEFKKSEVASNATLYFMSEPVLLDNFLEELKRLKSGVSSEAALWATA